MFGLVLTFVACLGAHQPARCQTISIPFDGSQMQCVMFGQTEMALWVREHDGWLPRRGYRCETGKSI